MLQQDDTNATWLTMYTQEAMVYLASMNHLQKADSGKY